MATPIGNSLGTSPAQVRPVGQITSETTWKTHALVVLGHILVSMGLALVVGSFYISSFHPLLALAAPVPPIAFGAVLLNRAPHGWPLLSNLLSIGAPPIFKGIVNESGHDCWINATMQLLLHIPAFADRIRKASSGFRLLSHPLEEVFRAFDAYERGDPIHSKVLREALVKANVASPDANTQDDPIYFLDFALESLGYALPKISAQHIHSVEDEEPTATTTESMIRYFTFGRHTVDTDKSSLTKLFEDFFSYVEVAHTGTRDTVLQSMQSPPGDFVVSLGGGHNDDGSGKEVRERTVPMSLELPKEFVGKTTTYSCDGLVYHWGHSRRSGHWIAVIKKEGKWWHASDNTVHEISESEATTIARKATILHYSKIEPD